MSKFLEKVADFLTHDGNPRYHLHEIRIEFIDSKTEMLGHIERCKKSRGVIGIYSSALGDGMFLSAVEAVYKLGADTLVELKPYDFKKGLQGATTVSMKDISCICPFNQILS
jgi:hypothetical protein